jgi:hypothetical protein
MAGPVSASTRSKARPSRSVWWITARIENTPTRLAMKLGVSKARTTPLPSAVVRKVSRSSSSCGSVPAAGISSTRCM